MSGEKTASTRTLEGRDLRIKELQGWRKKEQDEEDDLEGRGEKKEGDESARNKVPCQAGCTVSRETMSRVSTTLAPFVRFRCGTHPFDEFHATSC